MKLGYVDPTYQLAYEGSTVYLKCFSFNEPSWRKDGNVLPIISVLGVLTLIKLNQSDSGTYTCEGRLSASKLHIFQATSTLLVGVKQKNIIRPTIIRNYKGEDINFTCPADIVKWYFSESDTLPKVPPISTQNILIIKKIELKHTGFYFCYGSLEDNATNFLTSAELRINDPHAINPKILYVSEGWPAKFECLSNNTAVWYRYYLAKELRHISEIELHVGPKLTFPKATKINQGFYECKSTTDIGQTFRAMGYLSVEKRRPHKTFHDGKVVEMETFVGPRENITRDVDLNMFSEPKSNCIKEGIWTRVESARECNPKRKRRFFGRRDRVQHTQSSRFNVYRRCIKPLLRNGSAIFKSVNVGDVVYYRCAHGHFLIGSSSQECTQGGVWSGKTPNCERVLESKGRHTKCIYLVVCILIVFQYLLLKMN